LVDGVTLTLLATAVWYVTERNLQTSYEQENEKKAPLRLFVFYGVSLISAAFTLSLAGVFVNHLLQWLFGKETTLTAFINQNGHQLAGIISFLVLWVYYGRHLQMAISDEKNAIRQNSLRRIYTTILAFWGNVVTFIGVWTLLALLADHVWGTFLGISGWRIQLCSGIAELLIGLPLWLRNWSSLQRETSLTDEVGQVARCSILRRGYLYLIIFAAVVGLMSAGGFLVYRLFNAVFGNGIDNLFAYVTKQVLLILLVLIWLLYHQKVLQKDQLETHFILEQRQANFSTLILEPERDWPVLLPLIDLINRQLPDLPVRRLNLETTDYIVDLDNTASILLPMQLSLTLPEAIQEQLKNYTGKILLVPFPTDHLGYIHIVNQNPQDLMKATIEMLRQLAEGEPEKANFKSNGWLISGYILGIIFTLYFLLAIFRF
jgi:hypothetical protein